MDTCIGKLETYYKWFHNPDIQNLSAEGRQVLEKGFVYSYAVNRNGRPFSVMNLGDMDFDKYKLNVFYQALNHVNNKVIN